MNLSSLIQDLVKVHEKHGNIGNVFDGLGEDLSLKRLEVLGEGENKHLVFELVKGNESYQGLVEDKGR